MNFTNQSVVSFDDEALILVDADDAVVGYDTKAACHDGDGKRHRAFSVLLFDGEGKMLLQQRSPEKRLWPMIWSNACCSHPRRGEDIPTAAQRRMREELGVDVPLRELFKFEYQASWEDAGSEHEVCTVFVGRLDFEPRPNPTEIYRLRWIPATHLQAEFARTPDAYSPWLQLEWQQICTDHWNDVETLWAPES